jgi:hypothetical protein
VLSLSVLLSTLVAAQAAEYTFTPIEVSGSFITVALCAPLLSMSDAGQPYHGIMSPA